MDDVTLVIGNRNYSSWSLRAWLALKKSDVPFETVVLPLDTPEFASRIGEFSPAGRVPVLLHKAQKIWDSLAICEYVNEQFASGLLWPEDAGSRAIGRSIAAEMHSGFPDLRSAMPMNCRVRDRIVERSDGLNRDIDRVITLWTSALEQHDGDWLLGRYSIADAMFAPVVLRFQTYGVELPERAQAYALAVLADTDLQMWVDDALHEEWVVEADEAGVDAKDL